MPGGGGFGWAPGEFTDDTQMTIVLARHLRGHVGGIDQAALAGEFAHWARDAADVGNQTRSVLGAVGRGVDWRTAARALPLDAAGNGSLSPATVHKYLVILRQALAEAVVSRRVPSNPGDGMAGLAVNATTERRALTQNEIAALVRAAGGTRFDVAIRLAIVTGMRESEILGLRWADVDLDGRRLTVRRALSYAYGKMAFKEPKSARSWRTIELSATTVAMLREHRTRQAEHRLHVGPVWQEHDLVLPSGEGKPWLPRDFYRDYRTIVDATSIEEPESVTFHVLRHTAATQWIRAGVDILTVSRRLGHASAAFTMDVYGHLLAGQQRHAAEVFDHLLG